jgi:hypothetical protein
LSFLEKVESFLRRCRRRLISLCRSLMPPTGRASLGDFVDSTHRVPSALGFKVVGCTTVVAFRQLVGFRSEVDGQVAGCVNLPLRPTAAPVLIQHLIPTRTWAANAIGRTSTHQSPLFSSNVFATIFLPSPSSVSAIGSPPRAPQRREFKAHRTAHVAFPPVAGSEHDGWQNDEWQKHWQRWLWPCLMPAGASSWRPSRALSRAR